MPWGDNEGGFWSAAHAVFARLFSCWRVQIFGLKSGGTEVRSVLVDDDGTVHVTGTMSGGGGSQFDDGDAVDTDSQGNLVLGATAIPGTARALRCSAGGTLLVDGSAVTQPVSGTVAVSAVGGTVTVAGSVTVSDGSGPLTVDGTVAVSSVGGTVAVSAASLPLPTGAATEATLASAKTDLDTLAGVVTASRAAVNPIAGQAGVQGGAGASTALTQRVAIATDANTIAGAVTVTGNVAHDGADSGNPVKIGYAASNADKTAVSADGDRVDAWGDQRGRAMTCEGWPGDSSLVVKTLTGTSNVEVVADPGASKAVVIRSISASNTNANTSVRLDIKDNTTTIFSMFLSPNGGGFVQTFKHGIKITDHVALNAALSASVTDVRLNVEYTTIN